MTPPLPLDHLALRVRDRDEAVRRLTLLGYKPMDSFPIQLEDGSTAQSYALRHDASPDVFVSSGPEDSKMARWVDKRGGRGAVHHLAFVVDDVYATMKKWQECGVNFDRAKPLVCSCDPPLIQIFTEEDPATGLVYELIQRNGHPGFCRENVTRLMDGSSE